MEGRRGEGRREGWEKKRKETRRGGEGESLVDPGKGKERRKQTRNSIKKSRPPTSTIKLGFTLVKWRITSSTVIYPFLFVFVVLACIKSICCRERFNTFFFLVYYNKRSTPVPAYSVPFWRKTRNCSGVSLTCHSASVRFTFGVAILNILVNLNVFVCFCASCPKEGGLMMINKGSSGALIAQRASLRWNFNEGVCQFQCIASFDISQKFN